MPTGPGGGIDPGPLVQPPDNSLWGFLQGAWKATTLAALMGVGAVLPSAIGAANTVLTSSGAAPQWSNTLTLAGAVASTTTSTGALVLSGANAGLGMAGTLNVGGQVNVGGGAISVNAIYGITGNPLTGINQWGYVAVFTGTSAGTTSLRGMTVAITSGAAAYTVGAASGHYIFNTGVGAGSTITRSYSIYAETQTGGASGNCGFYYGAGTPTGTNWSIYIDSAVKNYLGTAATLINTTTDDAVNKLQVNGGIRTLATTDATGTTVAALLSDGGLGVVKAAFIGTNLTLVNGVISQTVTDAVTNTTSNNAVFTHLSSGTVANNFGINFAFNGQDDSGTNRNMAGITVTWSVAASATRTSRMRFNTVNVAGAVTTALQLDGAAASFATGFPLTLNDTTDATTISTGCGIFLGGVGIAKRLCLDGGTGKTIKIINSNANAAVAVTLGSIGPTGSTAGNPQGWMRVDVNGTDRFIPFW